MPTEINENLIFGIIVFIILTFLLIASIFVVYIKKRNIKTIKQQKTQRKENLDLRISNNIYRKLVIFFEKTFKKLDSIEMNNNVSEISQFKKDSKEFIRKIMSEQLYKDFKYKSDDWKTLDILLKKLEKDSVMTWKRKHKKEIEEVIYGK